MNRIVIVGASGAGKTTLAKKLGAVLKMVVLKMNVYHLDRIFWQRGWKRIQREKRIDILEDIVQRKQWIIEGSYFELIEGRYSELSESCLDKADTIIFLNLSFVLCLKRVIKRHYKEFEPRRDLPMESVDRLSVHLIMKVIFFKLTKRPSIMQKLNSYKGKEIIILRTTQDVDNFIAQQQELMYELVHVSNPESVRQFILT